MLSPSHKRMPSGYEALASSVAGGAPLPPAGVTTPAGSAGEGGRGRGALARVVAGGEPRREGVAVAAAAVGCQGYGEMAPPPHRVTPAGPSGERVRMVIAFYTEEMRMQMEAARSQMRMRMVAALNAQMRMFARVSASPAPSLLAQGPLDTDASSSAPLAIVSVGMDSHPSEAAGYGRQELAMHFPCSYYTRNLHNLLPQEQQLVLAPPHFITRPSGGRGRNGGGPPDFIELLAQCLGREYLRSQQRPDYDLEAGGQAHRVGGGAAAPVQQPPEVDAGMVQALVTFLPMCVTAYPVLKDAPDYIKFTIFGGLAVNTVVLFIGTRSNSVARRGLTIRLVSFSAIAVLTFCTASQFSSRIYVALTALIGVVLNLIIMLLQF